MATITKRDRQARISAYAGFAVQGLCFAALVSRVPDIQRAHGLSDTALSIMLLLVPVIAGVGSGLSGRFMSKHGSAVVLRVSQPLVCASVAAVGLTGANDPALYAAIVVFGLFTGAVDASMNAQAVAVEEHYGKSMLTGFHAIWSAAAGLAAIWTWFSDNYILADQPKASLSVGFAVPAVLGIVISLATGPRLVPRKEEDKAPTGAEMKAAGKLVPWRPVLIIGIAMACFYIADSMLSNFGTLYVEDEVDGEDVAPLALAAYQVAMVASRTFADLAVRRFGAVTVVRVGTLVGAVGMIAVVAAQHPLMAVAGFGITGLGLCVVAPISFSAAGQADPTGLGIAVARVNIFNYVGFVLGALIVTIVQPMSSLRVSYIVPTVLTLVILALAKGFQPVPARPADAEEPYALAQRPVV